MPWVILFLVLWTLPAWAVDRNANTGNYNSVIAATQPGDRLILAAGTYPNFVFPCGKSTNSQRTTITVADGATVTLNGQTDFSADPCSPSTSNHGLIIDGKNRLILDKNYALVSGMKTNTRIDNGLFQDFIVRRTRIHGMAIGGSNLVVRHVTVHNIGVDDNGANNADTGNCGGQCHAFYIVNARQPLTIENSLIHHVNGWCMTLEAGIFTVRNNVWHTCSVSGNGGGVQLTDAADGSGGPQGSVVYNNVGYGPFSGSMLFPQRGISVWQNTFSGSTSEGINARDGNNTLRNNIVYDNSNNISVGGSGNVLSDNLCGGSGGTSNCQKSGNPGFVSPAGGNFKIASPGSPAVAAAPRLAEVPTDLENIARQNPTTLGAYEFTTGPPSFQFIVTNPIPSGTAPTLTWSAVTSSGSGLSCAASVTSGGTDALWNTSGGNPSSGQLVAGGNRAVTAITATRTYRMQCSDSAGLTTVDRPVSVIVACTRATFANGGARWPIPGTIEAENFDTCTNLASGATGEGTTHHDIDAPNQGGAYRLSENVDIETAVGGGNGHAVSFIDATEWLEYLVTVSTTGSYIATVYVAYNGTAKDPGGTFHLEVDGANVSGPLSIPFTGGWNIFTPVTATFPLTAGNHTLRLAFDTESLTCCVGNVDRMVFTSATPGPPVANFSGTPLTGTVPLAVTFTDSSTGSITSRSWTFGDGGTSTATNPSHTYQSAGTYTVALTATGPGGSNTATKTGYITVSSVATLGTTVKHTFDEGAGTTAADTSGNPVPHPCTLSSSGWNPGIIGPFGLNANGSRNCTFASTPDTRPVRPGMSVWVRCPANAADRYVGDMGAAWGTFVDPAGNMQSYVETNLGPVRVTSTGVNIKNDTNHMLTWTFDTTGLRQWIDAVPAGFQASTGTPRYTGTETFAWASSWDGVGFLTGCTLDHGLLFDQPLNQAQVTALFQDAPLGGGTRVTHMRYYADAAEGFPLVAVDTDLSVVIGTPVGLRFAISHQGLDTGQYFPLWCSRGGASPLSATKVTNSFGSLGLSITQSPFVNMGDVTSDVPAPNGIPLDGLSFTPGHFVADIIDPLVTTTLRSGQVTFWEYRVDTGLPAVVGDTFVCQPRFENDALLNGYANITTMTLQGIAPPTDLRVGGTMQGGTP